MRKRKCVSIMKTFIYVCVAITVTCFLARVSECTDEEEEVDFLLPGDLVPTHYDVSLEFLDTCSAKDKEFVFRDHFHGLVDIVFTAIKPGVSIIEINSFHLRVSRIFIMDITASDITEIDNYQYYPRERKLLIYLPWELQVDVSLVLHIEYVGDVFPSRFGKNLGIFLTKDKFQTGRSDVVTRQTIATQFEPNGARNALPCFDEPMYKATFALSLNVSTCILKKGYYAHSNTPVKQIVERGERSIIRFEDTDFLMSTYLLSFVVSPYTATAAKQFNSSYPDLSRTEWKELRTWGPEFVVNSFRGYIAQEAGARLLEVFSNHLDIGYPLKKMDQVSVFKDFSTTSGMENWGIINYNLRSKDNCSLILLLSHEIAHQWFGNLVTCQWWSYLWLNEGFAVYFSYYGMEKIVMTDPNPSDCNPKLSFIVQKVLGALASDRRPTQHPVTRPVEDPEKYNEMFDTITYAKGGSILRMWSHVLGEEAFIKSLRRYLKNNKFGSATPQLLTREFDSVASISSSKFNGGSPSKYFTNWHLESNFPVVEVKKISDNPSRYLLRQRVFGKKISPSNTKWNIPISFSTDLKPNFGKTHAMFWLREDEDKVTLNLTSSVKWIIVNNQFTGYYRVKYDRENFENLIQVLMSVENYRKIPAANRIQILSDLNEFASVENLPDIDYRFVLDLSLYLKHETDYFPWEAALKYMFSYLDVVLSKNERIYRFFKLYMIDLLRNNYERLTFYQKDSDTCQDKRFRHEIVKWACKMDYPECVLESYDFIRRQSPRNSVHNKMFEIAYCTDLKNSREEDWNALWENYVSNTNLEEKSGLLFGMSCSKDKNVLRRILSASVDPSLEMDKGERKAFFMAVLNSDPGNIDVVLEFFEKHYESIEELYDGYQPVSEMLVALAKKLATDEEVKKLRRLMEAIENNENVNLREKSVADALEASLANNKWIKTKSEQVNVWLLSRYG